MEQMLDMAVLAMSFGIGQLVAELTPGIKGCGPAAGGLVLLVAVLITSHFKRKHL